MINQDILYLKKSNRSTFIKYINQSEMTVNILMDNLLNDYLLQDLTTLKGRIDAISKVYHIFKHIPIYLKDNIVLIQTNNKKEIDNIYINSYNIIDMVKDSNQTTKVVFIDGSQMIVNRPYHLLKKYYDLSLQIRKK